MYKILFSISFLILLFSGCSQPKKMSPEVVEKRKQNFKDGQKLLKEGKYDEAYKKFNKSYFKDKGNPNAFAGTAEAGKLLFEKKVSLELIKHNFKTYDFGAYNHFYVADNNKYQDPKMYFYMGYLFFEGRDSQLSDYKEYKKKPQYDKALTYFLKSANLGYKEAYAKVGDTYKQLGELDKAVKYYQGLAVKNNPYGSLYLGQMYQFGLGVEVDFKKAQKHYKNSSKLGLADANKALKNMQNIAVEVEKIKSSVKKEDPSSMYILATFYLNGSNGLKKDHKKAFELLKRSALKGNNKAQVQLGKMLIDGIGTKANIKEGIKFLEKAALQKDPYAYYYLGLLYNMQKNKDEKKAFKYMLLASKLNIPQSYSYTAEHYFYGSGVKKDTKQAKQWLEKAVKMPDPKLYIKNDYIFGNDLKKDFKEILYADQREKENIKWYKNRSEHYDAYSHSLLASIHEKIKTVEDRRLAYKHYYRAALEGNGEDQYILGAFIINYGYFKNPKTRYREALKWFKLAKKNNIKGAKKAADIVAKLLRDENIKQLNQYKNSPGTFIIDKFYR